ncbi:MAG: O-antigen ligase [Alphaproteobacteria bacterium]|nr:O-antigen ligase [Alphaproteobacteria bacterium]
MTQHAHASNRTGEYLFVMPALLLMIGVFKPLFGDVNALSVMSAGYFGNWQFQVASGVVYAVALAVFFFRPAAFTQLWAQNKWLLVFSLFILISPLWSDSPWVAFRRALALTGTTVFAFYLVLRFRPEELLALLTWAFLLAGLASLLTVIAVPEIGISPIADAWRGVLGHKNDTGRIMVLGAIVCGVATAARLVPTPVGWTAFTLCALFVVMSQSRAAWVSAAFLIVLMPFLWSLRRSPVSLAFRMMVVAIVVCGGFAVFMTHYTDATLVLIGRDDTLTGRTNIWAEVITAGVERPWLGAGYRTFFMGASADSIDRIAWLGYFTHAHNSYLDLWLDLGFVGAAILTPVIATALYRSMRRLTVSRDAVGLLFPLFLVYMLVFGLVTRVFPEHGTITWVLFVATLLYLSPVGRTRASPSPQEWITPRQPRSTRNA